MLFLVNRQRSGGAWLSYSLSYSLRMLYLINRQRSGGAWPSYSFSYSLRMLSLFPDISLREIEGSEIKKPVLSGLATQVQYRGLLVVFDWTLPAWLSYSLSCCRPRHGVVPLPLPSRQ